jgi:hypothetical protein
MIFGKLHYSEILHNRLWGSFMKSRSALSSSAAILAVFLAAHEANAALCNVPNGIANGQVADATKVMENFEAVADCAEGGVTTTGTPTTGSIAVISGSNTIASGNLTGDVTTSGGAVTTLSNSGVTAGSYSNPNLTIDSKGRITSASSSSSGGGGAGGGLYDISMGVPSVFTNVNIGGNSSVVVNGSKAITIKAGTSTPSSPTLYGVAVPVPTSTPYMVSVLALPNFNPVRWSGVAVGYYDSTTQKLVTLVSFNGSAFGFAGYSFQNWSSATNRVSASEPGVPRSTNFGQTWFGIKDDGTAVSVLVSQDGADYYPLFSQTKSGGYLSAYDSIFIGLFVQGGSGSEGAANNNVSVTFLAYDPNGLTRLAGN